MKKSAFIIISMVLLFSACGTMRLADVSNLTIGMTQNEVNQIMRQPIRVLSSTYTQDGRQDVYEYYTYRNEAYAIEFWDGRLSRYDFMYEDIPPAGIAPRPPYTTYPNRPSQPVRPSQPNRPESSRPSNTNRPGNSTSNSGRPTTKPSEDNKPGNSGRSSSGGTERPSYGTSNRPSSRSNTQTAEQSKQTEENKDKK